MFRGCLLGLAVGDALGAPLEGLSPQQIKTHYGRVRNYVDGVQAWKRKPYRWRLRGLYSDDTQQALAITDILLDFQRIDQERLADLYLALMTPKGAFVGAHRGIGRSFRQVLAALERGIPARLTGQTTAGIGAAMRIAPISLYFRDESSAMFDSVMAASLMTHRDIRSLSGALGVVHAVRRLVAGEPRDPSLLLWVASDLLKDEKEIARRHCGRCDQHWAARAQPLASDRARRITPGTAARDASSRRSWSKPTDTGPSRFADAPPWAFPPRAFQPVFTSCSRPAVLRRPSPRLSIWVAIPIPPVQSWEPWPARLRRRRDPRALARWPPEPRGNRGPRPGALAAFHRRSSDP